MDDLRIALYPLGYIATLVFGSRLLIQWLQSERAGKSVVTAGFWRLSLLGNALLFTHSFIQMQFHVAIVQVCNGVIAWRNLNLIRGGASLKTLRFTLFVLAGGVLLTTAAFALQGEWFRIPVNMLQKHEGTEVAFFWHIVGVLGVVLFNSRFWVQWWDSEQKRQSVLSVNFWLVSLLGELFCLIYFLKIGDLVNLIGPLFGVVPYARNLLLSLRTA